MGKKYIIELEEPEMFDERKYYQCSQMPWWSVSENIVENLTPYTEPDMEQVRKEAYDKGYDDATAEIGSGEQAIAEKSYQKGLSDAWEAARKIIHMPEGDLLNIFTECYSAVCTALQVVLKYDASEVIEKIRQYEQEKEMDGLRQNIQTIVDQCGYSLDEIAEVLQKMKES